MVRCIHSLGKEILCQCFVLVLKLVFQLAFIRMAFLRLWRDDLLHWNKFCMIYNCSAYNEFYFLCFFSFADFIYLCHGAILFFVIFLVIFCWLIFLLVRNAAIALTYMCFSRVSFELQRASFDSLTRGIWPLHARHLTLSRASFDHPSALFDPSYM